MIGFGSDHGATIAAWPRRTRPSPRICMFARELAAHPLLLDAILKARGGWRCRAALEQLEAAAQAKAVAPEPMLTPLAGRIAHQCEAAN